MWQHVPIIVLFIGASLFIQGAYTIAYLRGDPDRWGDLATGALFAGEALSACVGAGGLIQGIIHNIQQADQEMAPVLAGLLMVVQALLALVFLLLPVGCSRESGVFNGHLRLPARGFERSGQGLRATNDIAIESSSLPPAAPPSAPSR